MTGSSVCIDLMLILICLRTPIVEHFKSCHDHEMKLIEVMHLSEQMERISTSMGRARCGLTSLGIYGSPGSS